MSDNHSCCTPRHTDSPHAEHLHAHPAVRGNVNSDEIADCPVMKGNHVVKADAVAAGLVRDYEGVRYYLCCAGCAPQFDEHPEKYATAS